MAEVQVRNLIKEFGNVRAVDNLSLEIADREIICFVGPSGCGKTTTLRLIAGLERSTSGEILIGGKDITRLAPAKRDIAMVFQNFALYPHMTVRDNIALSLHVQKMARSEIRGRVSEVARLLEIEELLDRKPNQLSGGQKQRVAVGRAIVRRPAALLMDEPLSNLDAKLRVTMRAELKALIRRLQITTIYVTHDQVEAMTMGDRIVVMDGGRIQQVGEPQRVYEWPANTFVAGMVGSPGMNIIDGIVEAIGNEVAVTAGDLRVWPEPRVSERLEVAAKVLIGIRPEKVIVNRTPDDGAAGWTATVDVVEPQGGSTLIHVSWAGKRVVAEVPGASSIQEQQQARLSVDPGSVRLFDSATGACLGSAVQSPLPVAGVVA